MKISNPVYLEKVKTLTEEEQERLLSRMSGKLPRRLEKDKLSKEDALAIQLEIEDEQLQEWRAKMHALNGKSKPPEKGDKTAEKEKKAKVSAKAAAAPAPAASAEKPAAKKSRQPRK